VNRKRHRSVIWAMKSALSLAVAGVILVGGCARAGPNDEWLATASEGRSSPASDGVPGGCAYGPWAEHCPEAEWAREVLDAAGYPLTGATGSALVGRESPSTAFYFWAFEAEKASTQPLRKAIEGEGYRLLSEIEGISVFTDGIRLAWEIQGLYVWVEGGPVNSLQDIDPESIRRIVRASAHVPYR
jgi:hypothetical protein